MRVLFVCVHNAARSQMAEALLREHSAGEIEAASAGSRGAGEIDPLAAAVMAEIGVPITGFAKQLTARMIDESDRVITMGCGVDSTECPANWFETEDWGIDDPRGHGIEAYRQTRDRIRKRVVEFLARINEPEA